MDEQRNDLEFAVYGLQLVAEGLMNYAPEMAGEVADVLAPLIGRMGLHVLEQIPPDDRMAQHEELRAQLEETTEWATDFADEQRRTREQGDNN